MTGVLLLGFLIGMRHALEADHLAAVATLAARTSSLGDAVRHGLAWGFGHTLTLFAMGGVVIALGTTVPAWLESAMEFVVGLMLIALGADVIRRMVRDRLHFHVHRHQDGVTHFHAHTHAPAEQQDRAQHDPDRHEHPHAPGFPLRALAVGLMHGLAGSAALVVLAAGSVTSLPVALAYLALFGIGSMLGMGLLSAIIAIPLRRRPKGLTWTYNGVHALVGLFSVGLGLSVCIHSVG